jgi:hypothetical protein
VRTASPAGRSDGEGRCGGSVGAAAGDRCVRWDKIGAGGTDFSRREGLSEGLRWC